MNKHPNVKFQYKDTIYNLLSYDSDDYIHQEISTTKTFYEIKTLEFIRNRDLCGTYVDIGSNIGNHSVYFATQTNCNKLIAIEGNPEIWEIWNKNIAKNVKAQNKCSLIKSFITSKKTVFFNKAPKHNIGMSHLSSKPETEQSTQVQGKSLQSVLKNVKNFSFLKVDVEGHEIEVLESCGDLLKKFSPEICIEASHTSINKILIYLSRFHYLPLASLTNENVYFIKYPAIISTIIFHTRKLPSFISSRITWRLIRITAIVTGRLPRKEFRKNVPNFELQSKLTLE